jgi:glycosyltransferase involved in cell wall biosynthesis
MQRVGSYKFYRPLEFLLGEGHFDIIHAHCVYSPMAHSACYIANRMGIPSILTLHSVIDGAGKLALRSLQRLFSWGNWPTVLSAVSKYAANALVEITERDDVIVLPNAVRLDDWSLRRNETRTVVCVTRFAPRKRPLDLIRMIPEVLRRLPSESRPQFLFVGDGPLRPKIEREIARLGIANHVQLLGARRRSEVREILGRAAVFALPSYQEAYPISVIEARAVGVPVVARSPNGVSEIIEHGINGLLADSTEQFIANLVTLMLNQPMRARMSAAALNGIEYFSWEHGIQRHLTMYEQAIAKKILPGNELSRIPGAIITPVQRLDRYGDSFIETLRGSCDD